MTHDAFGSPLNAPVLGGATDLERLANSLLSIAADLDDNMRIAAMRSRYVVDPHSRFVTLAPSAEVMALQGRLRARLLTEAEQVCAAIQQVIRQQQADQAHPTVQA